MAMLTHRSDGLHGLLSGLVQLELFAVDSYEAALPRLRSPAYRDELVQFRDAHARHAEQLSSFLRANHETPPHAPQLKRVLTHGKMVRAGLRGDTGLLTSLTKSESELLSAYEHAAESEGAPTAVRETLRAFVADEQRHCAFLDDELAELELPAPMPGGPSC